MFEIVEVEIDQDIVEKIAKKAPVWLECVQVLNHDAPKTVNEIVTLNKSVPFLIVSSCDDAEKNCVSVNDRET
jgi:uncharacterized membrane protein